MAESTKNPKNLVFAVNDLTKLLDENEKSALTQAALLTAIKGKCSASDPVLSASSLHVLTKLVERGGLAMSKGLSILISLLSAKEVIPGIVPAVTRLLILDVRQTDWTCPYILSNHPHPLVTILKHNWSFWDEISAFLHYVFFGDSKVRPDRRVALVRPVLSYVLADPFAPMLAKTEVVHMLLLSGEERVLIELLSYQQIDLNWCSLIRKIAQLSNGSLKLILAPALAVSVAFLIKNGHDPSLWIFYLNQNVTTENSDLVLNILVKVIPACPSVYLLPIVKFCYKIIAGKECTLWSASALAAAVLPWAIFPSSLLPNLTENFQAILKVLPDLPRSKNFSLDLSDAFIDSMPDARSALDLLILSQQWTDDARLLDALERLDEKFSHRWKSLLLAVLLNSKTTQITKLVLSHLRTICETDAGFCFPLWSVILYKLSKETNPHLQLYFLRMVPLMGIDKGNMSLVLGTYSSISKDVSATVPLRLNFLFSLFCVQRRTFPYLHRLLQEAVSIKTWESQVACASILLKLAQHSPDPHGKQIVGLLSDLLNNNPNPQGTEASAMAVSAISELCKADVIDVQQTWKALEPKMGSENRPSVAVAVCGLLGECAEYKDGHVREAAISRLWSFIEADCAADAAFLAMARFGLDDFQLKAMPARFRRNLKIPKGYIIEDGNLPIEEVLSYVPGECWVQVLENVTQDRMAAVERMLSVMVKKEIAELPRGLYTLPMGVEEPRNLAQLTHKSLLRALVESLQKVIRDGWNKPKLSTSILNILSVDFLRPIPPLNWSFLQPNPSDKLSAGLILKILSRQGVKSPSARKLLQENVTTLDVDKEIIPTMCDILPGISQCVTKTLLSSLASDLLRITLNDSIMFVDVLKAVRKSVALSDVPDANRTALANALKELLVDLPQSFEDIDELWATIGDLPEAIIERIASPRNWSEITSRRIRYALRVRRASALKSDQSLEYFTELIDVVCSRTEEQLMVKQELVQFFQQISSKSGSSSFRLLMTRLVAAGNNSSTSDEMSFLFDLVVICASVLSGSNLLVNEEEFYRKNCLFVFPGSIGTFFFDDSSEWMKNLPFTVESFYRLKKCEKLNCDQKQIMHRSLLALKQHPYCLDPSRRPRLFQ